MVYLMTLSSRSVAKNNVMSPQKGKEIITHVIYVIYEENVNEMN